MNADDFFMGWAFMVVLGPVYALINAILALPSTLLSRYVHKSAGFIAWVLTMAAILVYLIFPISPSLTSRRYDEVVVSIIKHIIVAFLYFVPQAAAYPLTRYRPWLRPLVAGGVALGAAILYIVLGFLFGATPD